MANDDDSKKGVEMILTNSDEWKKYEDKDPEEQARIIQHHWDLYGDSVVSTINVQRSNKIAQIRLQYIKAWDNGQTPPNSEQLLDLVCRRGLKGKNNKANRQRRKGAFWPASQFHALLARKICATIIF